MGEFTMPDRFLFCHISWMPQYSGKKDEPFFSTHGYVVEYGDPHERNNFKPRKGELFGYVPVPGKRIDIDRLGAGQGDDVDGITVVWFANNPNDPKRAYIVGWYRNATVYREPQHIGEQEYRVKCDVQGATLLGVKNRKFPIPHSRSKEGRKLGYGYGMSSVWYAEEDAAQNFLEEVQIYIDSVDFLGNRNKRGKITNSIGNALDDLDDGDLGNENPEKRTGKYTYIVRDPAVRKKVLKRAKGRCEYCGVKGFKKDDGTRFIETHHIIFLAEQGPDTPDNVIALCPNHHRQAHFGKGRKKFEKELQAKLEEII